MPTNTNDIRTNGLAATRSRSDLAMLLPYCIGLLAITDFHPARLLFPLGIAMVTASLLFRKQCAVEPMKLITSIALGTTAVQQGIHPETLSTAALLSGLIWILIAMFGLSARISSCVPKETLAGLNIAIGLSLILTALQLMWDTPYWSAMLFLLASALIKRRPVLALLLVILAGLTLSLLDNSGSWSIFNDLKMKSVWPMLKLPLTDGLSLWIALTVLVLPQLVLSADHNASGDKKMHGELAWGNSAANGLAGLLGSAPLGICLEKHSKGQPGKTRLSREMILVGLTFIVMAILFSESISEVVERLPDSAVGVMIFFAGLQLIMFNMQSAHQSRNIVFLLVTVMAFLLHPGLPVLIGIAYQIASRQGMREKT
jgi:hypothetical protein